ncbi:hypothetical protein Hamer_G016524 [Homarus americanus]|uniref:Uncharacterized protein n=1 Tax=Homarus americanus TaxID=6706 RepID=A0A8J5JTX0_HOMAM|nr:hypothetical protein Hamer_G016524 [Homarus americanus]
MFLSWNIRTVHGFTTLYCHVHTHNTDIVLLQEVFVRRAQFHTPKLLPGYAMYFSPILNGLIIYIKQSLQHKQVKTSRDEVTQDQLLQLNVADSHIHLCNIYGHKQTMKREHLPNPADKSILHMGNIN